MAAEREKIYECEVKRRRVKTGGGYEPFWKVKPVAVALADLAGHATGASSPEAA